MTKRRPGRRKRGSDPEDPDDLLFEEVEIGEGSPKRKMSALHIIMEQLWKKEAEGDSRALQVRMRYEKVFKNYRELKPQITFEGSDYSRSLSEA